LNRRVFVDVFELVEAQPAAFGFDLNPVPQTQINVGADAEERIRSLLWDARSVIVWLKD